MSSDGLAEASRLLDLLSDADRLRLIGRLTEGTWTVTALGQTLGMKPQTVARHVRSLEEAGLIQRDGDNASELAFDIEHLRALAAELRPDGADDFAGEQNTDARTLRSFVADGRLTQLPSQRSRWLVVLRWLVEHFEQGVEYPERQVNEILGTVHQDYAILRRQLVDEGFMARDHGVYWRLEQEG